MSTSRQNLTLGESAAQYLSQVPIEKRETIQPEVNRFVRWYGAERPLSQIAAQEIASYAESLSLSDKDYARRLELVRAFLAYLKKKDLTATNLSVHLKTKKGKQPLPAAPRKGMPESVPLTRNGYENMKAELETLKKKRPQLVDDIRKAAADKDFRENAPLHAAKEKMGHLEGKIIEIEETLKVAKIVGEEPRSSTRIGIGSSLVLCDLSTGEEIRYTIVPPKEVNPLQGKISSASPIGKSLMGRAAGDTVEVVVPAGKLRYQVKRVE